MKFLSIFIYLLSLTSVISQERHKEYIPKFLTVSHKIDDIDNKAEERSLSLKYSGDIGFTSSVLK